MRTKTAVLNNVTSVILQVITLIFGLIVPRLMIKTFGSELNGLVSSTKQIVSYLGYLELGITAALVYTLYQPMALKDYDEINPLVSRVRKEYGKISIGYFVGVISISFIYPFILKEELGYANVALLVFIVGIYGVLDFFAISKYRVLLDADLKTYVINLIATIVTVIQYVLTITLLLLNQSIYIVVLVPTIVLPIRNLLLRRYVKKNYALLDYNSVPSNIKLNSRIDAFISGLSDSLEITLPIVIVSFVVSLEMASVFSVYSMVFMGLAAIIKVFNSGTRTVFGNIYAKEELELLKTSNNYFEFFIFVLLTILYSSALALIIPFIKIYIKDVADVEYIYPVLGFLFTIWSVFHNSKIPSKTMIDATGNWKLMTKHNIVQIVILLVLSGSLGVIIGINGILIGMIISSVYKTIIVAYVSNTRVVKSNNKRTLMRLFLMFLIIILTNLPLFFFENIINVTTIFEWIIAAVVVVISVSVVTLSINYIFEKNTMKNILNKYIKPKFIKK